jgi:hypothetical protein
MGPIINKRKFNIHLMYIIVTRNIRWWLHENILGRLQEGRILLTEQV